MKSLGNLDLRDNYLLNPALKPVENFPQVPKVGSLIFKGQRVMICIEIEEGLPIWAPLTAPLNTHVHDNPVAQLTWTIEHNLNSSHVIAQVIGADGKHVIPDEVVCNFNETIITFHGDQAGRAVLMVGNEDGTPRDNYSFEQDFTESNTWVVNHMLGYNPIVRVFIGNQEVQPLAITHDSSNQATVTFSTTQTGHVRCV